MKSIQRCLAFLLALLCILPLLPGGEGDGGENAGGTGVWILPRAGVVGTGNPALDPNAQPRVAPLAFDSLANDMKLQVAEECGEVVATLFAGDCAQPIALPVTGTQVMLSSATLSSLAGVGAATSHLVIVDAAGNGYVMRLQLDLAQGRGALLVF